MMDVPAESPFTIPRLQFTILMAGLLLVHKPPGMESVKPVVRPLQTDWAPCIGELSSTVTTDEARQPEPME
jgi:hypothetical protein